MTNGCPELEWGAQECGVQGPLYGAPALHVFLHDGMPCSVLHELVGVGVVDVVLDPPGLKWVDQGHKHEGAHNILHPEECLVCTL